MTPARTKLDGSPVDPESFEVGWQAAIEWLRGVIDIKDDRRLRDAMPCTPARAPLKPSRPIEELGLLTRVVNKLHNRGIKTVGQLTTMSERDLRDIRSFGNKAVDDVISKLARHGYTLGKN